MKPFLVFERGGLKIGVIALSETQTRAKVMSGRGFGFEVLPYEAALTQAVTAVRKAGADALVVLADECPGVLEPMVRKHPEWKLAVLAGGHCHAPFDRKVGTTALVSPGRHWASYLRVKLSVDPSRPAGRRLAGVETRVVDVVAGPSAPPPDPALVQLLQPWIQKRDAVLGQRIGFTHSGLDAGSADLYAWVAGAMRGGTKSDVAIVNRKGIRAGLPAGPITAGEVYSVIPFENSVMGVKIKGAALVKALGNPAGVAAGVKKAGSGWVDGEGQKIDPDRVYAVALTDYLYFGGDGFDFEKADRQPVESGMVWQTMVIDQTKKLGSSEAQPLETLIR